MSRLYLLLVLLLCVFAASACSLSKIVLPYEEEPLCKIGYGGGYCGSITDVYDRVDKDYGVVNGKVKRR